MMVSITTRAALEPLKVQIGGEPSTLDPARALDQYAYGIHHNVIDGLFKQDIDGKLMNALCESYTVSKDGLVYRFKIKSAKWSDGKAVEIDDFVTGLRYALSPKTASPTADFFFAIQNARDVYQGKLPVEKLGVTREGNELVVRLEQPDASFLMELTLASAGPLRKDKLDANGGAWDWKFPVTGDYIISEYKPATIIGLSPNPHRPTVAKRPVQIRVFTEETTAMNLLESGHLDIISTVTSTEVARLKKADLIKTAPSTSVFYVAFNHEKAPFNDLDWRKAVAASADRIGTAKLLLGDEPVTSLLPSTLKGSLTFKDLPFQEAQKKVRDAISKSPKKPTVRLAYGNSAFTKTVVEKLQHDLKLALGLTIELEPMELKTLLARLKTDPPEMYFLGMSAVFNDPSNHLNAFSSSVQPNFSRYVSQAYETTLQKVKTSRDEKERTRAIERAQEILVREDVALIPLIQKVQIFGVSKKVKNFRVSPNKALFLREIEKH